METCWLRLMDTKGRRARVQMSKRARNPFQPFSIDLYIMILSGSSLQAVITCSSTMDSRSSTLQGVQQSHASDMATKGIAYPARYRNDHG